MLAHDSCIFWYVLETHLCGSDLHLSSIFLQRVPNEAKNDAKTRPENSFGNPLTLAAQQHFARCPWWPLLPSFPPSFLPSFPPSFLPSLPPSFPSSFLPSFLPSFPPSFPPFLLPSFLPSFPPFLLPSFLPSFPPSLLPSFLPSLLPSFPPSHLPSFLPSFPPSLPPSFLPSFLPSVRPSFLPSFLPSFPPVWSFIFFWCIYIFFDAFLFFLMRLPPHITTLQQFLGSISQIAPPIGLTKKNGNKEPQIKWKQRTSNILLSSYICRNTLHIGTKLATCKNTSKHVKTCLSKEPYFSFHNVVSISPAAWPAWPYLHCPESHLGCRKIFKKCVSLADVCRRSLRSFIIFTVIMMLQWTVVTMKSLKSIDNLPCTGHSKWSNMLRVVGMSGLSEAKYCEIVSKPKRCMDPWRAATALQHRQICPFPQHLLASASLLEPMAHHSFDAPWQRSPYSPFYKLFGCVVGIEHNQQNCKSNSKAQQEHVDVQ